MSKYTGLECPICKNAFKDDEDIVVCPECGAPYHRGCYQKENRCIYEDKHGTDQTWQRQEYVRREAEDKTCPRCATVNPSDSLFCSKCGQSLSYDSQAHGQAPTDSEQSYTPPGAGPNVGPTGMPYPFDPMGGVNPKDHIEGIEAGEIAKFVQTNTPYYMGRFLNLSAFNKGRFHFAAFLFGGGWFLYRKQYMLGFILTVFQIASSVAAGFLQTYYTTPLINELLPNAEHPTKYFLGFLQAWDALAAKSPAILFLVMLPTILSFLQIIEHILCGIFANKLYLKHCVKEIKQIKANATTPQEYEAYLKAKGGVSTSLAFSLMICYVIINFIPMFFNF